MFVLAVVHLLALMTRTVQGVCDSGLVPFNDSCYFFSQEKASWYNAMEICEAGGGWLVHDDSNGKHNWIVSQMKRRNIETIWIGGTRNDKGVWQYKPNSEKITTSFWTPGEQHHAGFPRCIMITKDPGYMWSDDYCLLLTRFICEKRPRPPGRSRLKWVTVPGGCDSGWVPFNDSCYVFSQEEATGDIARQICEENGGWLVHDDSNDKHNWIVSQMQKRKIKEIWIGGARNEAGVWQWKPHSQNITTAFWSPGWFYRLPEYKVCIMITKMKNYMWIVQMCVRWSRFICEQRMKTQPDDQ